MIHYNPKWMKRAIAMAEKSRGLCSPNPFVGAVIVKNGSVVGEGSTKAYGSDHAEIVALKKAGDNALDSDVYVTLEPCAHFGKTPPCAEALVRAGVKRVFVGITDPNPLVSGKGLQILKDHGIEVYQGFFETQIKQQLEYFLCRIEQQRPFVIWKAALSLDGKYAAQDGSSQWITCTKARTEVHMLRQRIDVILSGINTIHCDDPLLNVRLPHPLRQPYRGILDPNLEISIKSRICQSAHTIPTYLFYREDLSNDVRLNSLISMGLQVVPIPGEHELLDLNEVLVFLHHQGHYSILLETGSKLSSAFWSQSLIDKCIIYFGAKLLGGSKAILSELALPNIDSAIELKDIKLKSIGNSFVLSAYPSYR